jgi:hypothetical protein
VGLRENRERNRFRSLTSQIEAGGSGKGIERNRRRNGFPELREKSLTAAPSSQNTEIPWLCSEELGQTGKVVQEVMGRDHYRSSGADGKAPGNFSRASGLVVGNSQESCAALLCRMKIQNLHFPAEKVRHAGEGEKVRTSPNEKEVRQWQQGTGQKLPLLARFSLKGYRPRGIPGELPQYIERRGQPGWRLITGFPREIPTRAKRPGSLRQRTPKKQEETLFSVFLQAGSKGTHGKLGSGTRKGFSEKGQFSGATGSGAPKAILSGSKFENGDHGTIG